MRATRGMLALSSVAMAAGVALHAAGHGVLAGPNQWNLDGWAEIVDQRGAPAAAMTLLRYAALTASGYVVALGVLTLLVSATRVPWLEVVLRFLTPAVLRPLLGIVVVATLATPRPAGANTTDANPPVMVLASPTSRAPEQPNPPPTMRRVDARTPATTAVPAPPTTAILDAAVVSPVVSKPSAPSITTTVVARPTGAPATSTAPATWTIARGEHLWFVAERVVTQTLGADVHHGEIARYWRSLVDANRERLVDRDNADLVYAGQEFVLPPVPLR